MYSRIGSAGCQLVTVVLLCSLSCGPLVAQTTQAESAPVIEEVVVSATRRDLNIQDVSASVTAITNQEIIERGLGDLKALVRGSPGVTLQEPLRNRSTLTIRGINTDIGETQLTQDPVSLYINEIPATIPFAELVQPDPGLYDIERVEILRGPQGTLFGSGSLAGTVRLITRAPVIDRFEAGLQMDFADIGNGGSRRQIDGMLNVPLVEDSLAVRAVTYSRVSSGWVENETLGIDNGGDDFGARMSLLWHASEKLDVRVEGMVQDNKPDDADSWNPSLGAYKRASDVSERRPVDLALYNLTLDYQLNDKISLLSSTSFKTLKTDWIQDQGPFPGIGEVINASTPFDTDSFVQELRLVSQGDSPLSWVAGIYFFESDTDAYVNFSLPGLQAFVEGILGPGAMTQESLFAGSSDTTSEERAVYGDVTWQFTDAWSASAGLRFFRTRTVYDSFNAIAFDFDTLQDIPLPEFTNVGRDSNATWRAVLAWQPDEDRHYYFNVSKGYRVGQVNPNSGPSFVDPTDVVISPTYDPDESLNLELGAKTSWADGRLQLNAAIYHIDWSDIQVDAVRSSDNLNFIANAGDAVSRGLELELRALPGDALDLSMTLAWQDAEIESIPALESFLSGANEGDTLPGAAEFMASLMAQFHHSLSASTDLVLQGEANYVGDSPNRFSFGTATGMPNENFAINDSYMAVNGSVSLLRNAWRFTLYAENLFDNDDHILNIGATFRNPVITLPPRTIGLRVGYRIQ